ncbi:pali-domain-containing protein [Violaceomyces palustris]|uniref:Pali-domain-containing protein n=1 Tax=Violaceomyces palustris TaxID=1673888 RepID=A0ACD0P2F9_9BASI|nr:pali-domain-containing protein [Violaceomyces palustris]
MIRPATPGTLLVLIAAVLLGIVTISTPIIKSVYFLKATVGGSGSQNGQVATFGALGYCIGDTCSNPTLGYEFNPNELLGITLISAKYTQVVIKGLTYTLILHPVALAISLVAFVFGLISHCREMSRNCMGTCFAGIGGFFAALAFGLDLALFIIAKKRIDSVSGASATLGMAIWMTLAAWILLFLSGCAFSCGICSRRKRDRVKDDYGGYGNRRNGSAMGQKDNYAEQMRMDALDAEVDRKRRQAAWDKSNPGRPNDLPKFAEYETEHEIPLTADYENGAYHAPGGGAIYSNKPQPSTPSVASGFVAGVGPGYGRRQPTNEYASSPSMTPNIAGYGAHAGAQRAASNSSPAPSMPQPSPAQGVALYTPGIGPQPYRDGLDGPVSPLATGQTLQPMPTEEYHAANVSQADPYSGVAAATSDAHTRRQATAEYGHPTDYSGTTFGGVGDVKRGPSGYYPSSIRSPSEGGSRMKGPRDPGAISNSFSAGGGANAPLSPEIPYASPTNQQNLGRRQPTVDANDGFGLAALAAGAASGAHGSSMGHGSEVGYENYASSAYGHGGGASQHQGGMLGTHYEDASNERSNGGSGFDPHQQQHQQQYSGYDPNYNHHQQGARGTIGDDSVSSAAPPGYESAWGGSEHGNRGSAQYYNNYPREKS